MILYNVTVNIDDSVHDEWLEWMTTKHIPDVLATGLFEGNKIYKIEEPEAEEGSHIRYNISADQWMSTRNTEMNLHLHCRRNTKRNTPANFLRSDPS